MKAEFNVITSIDLEEFCKLVEAAIAGGWQLGVGFAVRTHTTEVKLPPDENGVIQTELRQVPVYYQPILMLKPEARDNLIMRPGEEPGRLIQH